jgi:branched-chain amino acid aminotransferase
MTARFPLVWQDGRIVPFDCFRLPPDDPALLFGLGAFTTAWASPGRVRHWDAHAERLRGTAEALGFACPPLPTAAELSALVARLGVPACAVRCNVSASGRAWCLPRPLPASTESVTLQSLPAPWAAADPWSALKTFHYGQRSLAGQRAAAAGFGDALLVDVGGFVLETARANVFARFDDGWRTPPLGPGVLPGVVRAEILRRFPVRETPLPLAELRGAGEAFLCNSVRGIVPIGRLDAALLARGDSWREFLPALG